MPADEEHHDPYEGDPYGDDPFSSNPLPELSAALETLHRLGRYSSDELAELLAQQMGGRGEVDHVLRRVAEAKPGWLAGLAKTDKHLLTEAAVYDSELQRERRRRRIRFELDAEDMAAEVSDEDRYVDGGTFIHDLPETPPSIWGHGNQVAWMRGEALMIVGSPGVGKTTITAQVVKARLVGGKVLGMEVTPGERVLYLAMDRPQQIARALARTLRDMPRAVLADRFVPWEGPPPTDFAFDPEAMLRMAREASADTVVVDSMKDAAIGLEDSRVGAGYNRARQLCLANGVEVIELHHNVKRGADGKPPNNLEDVFGSRWLTAGAGSVVFLHGKAGDPVVRWLHLKQPAEEVGPFDVAHDHTRGHSEIYGSLDLVEMAERCGAEGLAAKGVAVLMFENSKPSKAQLMKAMRKLDAHARAGELVRVDGDAATQQPTKWVTPEHGSAGIFDDDSESDDLI